MIDIPILDASNNKELLDNVISDIVLELISYVSKEGYFYISLDRK